MISARPPKAPTGRPPPITLPKVERSGRTPSSSCAPPFARRKPVITSSKMRSAPCASQRRRSPSWKPGSGRIRPALPGIGSTMIAAISPGVRAKRGLDRREVVERQGQGEGGQRGGDARAVGLAVGQRAGAGLHQQGVAVAVVAAVELDDLVAPGEAARQADPRSCRPRSRCSSSGPSPPRGPTRSPCAPGRARPDWGMPKLVPARGGPLHRLHHRGGRVAQDGGGPRCRRSRRTRSRRRRERGPPSPRRQKTARRRRRGRRGRAN